MRALLILAVLLVIPLLFPLVAYAQGDDGGSPFGMARLLSFGVSMGTSLLMGAIKKKTLPRQGMRNAIPATNSILNGTGAGAITGDPYSALAAVGGSLLMSGLFSMTKRIRTGRW